MAQELVCQMAKRNTSTVPYIEGSNDNYKYSMYDSLDETILLAGINTNACFRIDGNDNDFLHYCALDKNGFVIKITDAYDNFVARASGFRNGNCVFINQLRTIYDKCDNFYHNHNEKEKIIETFKKACLDIVETSQKNTEELNKIDYVFVTKSYALNKINSNVSLEVTNKIGNHPMDNSSTDWRNFTKNTVNLDESNFKNYFNTDYGNYPIICIASSKGYQIKAKNIKQGNVKAIYKRKRNKIIIVNNINEKIINKINKINGIFSYLNNQEFTTTTSIIDGSTIFIGDNWYIVYNNGKIINSCVLDFDKDAEHEFYIVSDILTNYSNEIDEIKLLEEINYKTLKLK